MGEEGVTRSHSDSYLHGRPGRAVLGEQLERGHRFWGEATTSCCRQRPDLEPTSGYSESEATSDDSCYRPRPPSSFRLSPSPHPEVISEASSRPSSRPSRHSSLAWDNYDSGPYFRPPAAIH